MKRVAFLTSGGDCQALNATMRGVAKALYAADKDIVIYGILEDPRIVPPNVRIPKKSEGSIFR